MWEKRKAKEKKKRNFQLVVFLARYPNDMKESFEKLTFPDAFRKLIISFFSSERTSRDKLDYKKLTFPNCKSRDLLNYANISKQSYT